MSTSSDCSDSKTSSDYSDTKKPMPFGYISEEEVKRIIMKEKQEDKEQKEKEEKEIYKRLLYLSACNGHLETVKFLVENSKPWPIFPDHILHDTYYHGHFEVFKYLIEHGADTYDTNSRGETILLTACSDHNYEMIEYLLNHDADPLIHDCAFEFPFNDEIREKLKKYAVQLMKEDLAKNKK